MAVREEQDRRVGGVPEKLLTLEEAAQWLRVPADDVEALIRAGRLSAFRLGGSLLRVRLQDVEALNRRLHAPSPTKETGPAVFPSFLERWSDFLYFNDFYLIALALGLVLLAVIWLL